MFEMTEEQNKMAEEFVTSHKCGLEDDLIFGGKKTGAIGGSISYCFKPTSIGVILVVKCSCGESENLTDFASW